MRVYFNAKEAELDIKFAVAKKIDRAIRSPRARALFERQAEILTSLYVHSAEFLSLRTKLVGEFGFTSEEVAQFDNVAKVLNSWPITKIEIISGLTVAGILLQWCDYDAFKEHPIAMHELTQYEPSIHAWSLTDTVSWVEWLEEGMTVRGYRFDPTQRGKFSRSRAGLMRSGEGNIWTFQPTNILHRVSKMINIENNISKGFGLVFRRA